MHLDKECTWRHRLSWDFHEKQSHGFLKIFRGAADRWSDLSSIHSSWSTFSNRPRRNQDWNRWAQGITLTWVIQMSHRKIFRSSKRSSQWTTTRCPFWSRRFWTKRCTVSIGWKSCKMNALIDTACQKNPRVWVNALTWTGQALLKTFVYYLSNLKRSILSKFVAIAMEVSPSLYWSHRSPPAPLPKRKVWRSVSQSIYHGKRYTTRNASLFLQAATEKRFENRNEI